ncbi:peptide-N4-(N-acetyl-beta- glucosaminyl)asparagine amidase [Tulasnella sp. 418]|nr:peptide-N4-(N-acetyl-beta- glucosaminyl)asparagine amidase [Tulasnella sp. 418]
MDPHQANSIAIRLTAGWISYCTRRGLGTPRRISPSDAASFSMLAALFMISISQPPQPTAGLPSAGPINRRPQQQIPSKHGLHDTIHRLDADMDTYERSDLQDLALQDCIPLEQLHSQAEEILKSSPSLGFEDALAEALVKWFKKDFFKWADPIICPRCEGKTTMRGMVEPTAEEREKGGGRVELHKCDNEGCGGVFRFARYNDPKVLMKTRIGRCGEFANLFCLFIRAIGLRARYVWNAEDHVWNEHYSPTLKRWVHMDSCEASRDEPMIYDRGWGKKMSYILAFSITGAQDVSRGYIQDWDEALKRRKQGSETELKKILDEITQSRRRNLTPEDVKTLQDEDNAHESWILKSKEPSEIDGEGRISGTQEWKESRGEAGGTSANPKPL